MVVTFLLVIMSAAIMHLSKRTVEVMQQKIEVLQDSRRAAEAARAGKAPADGGGTQDTGAIGLKPISSPRDAAAGSSIAQLGSPLVSETIVNGKDSLTILTRDTPDTQRIRVKSAEQPKETRGAQVTSSSTLLRVDFDADAIRYTDEDAKKVLDFLKTSVRPGTKYEVWSLVAGAGSVSEPMRIAFYRAEVQAIAPPYVVIAIVVLLFALAAALVAFPANAATSDDEGREGRFLDVFRRPRLIAAVVAQFFYVGAQV
ncbi:hypothetical protein LTR94_028263, partial [Friedmanniomyces endolithicus]